MKNLILLALVAALAGCGNESGSNTQPKPSTSSAPTAAQNAPLETNIKFSSLAEAIAATRSDMTDGRDAEISQGAAVLALWGASGMKWDALQKIQPGKFAMVMKDADTQRGKLLCPSGHVIEIEIDRSVKQKIYSGGMYDDAGRIYRFIAVGSTGEIVQGSRAKFCGIIIGQHHYGNSVGGVAHAVQLVGMFDLPENKTK